MYQRSHREDNELWWDDGLPVRRLDVSSCLSCPPSLSFLWIRGRAQTKTTVTRDKLLFQTRLAHRCVRTSGHTQVCGSWLSGGELGLRSALPSISRAGCAVCSHRKIPKWVPFPGWFASGDDFPLGKTKESAALCLQGKCHGRCPQWCRPLSPERQ